ncbi:Tetratricopeptide repeat-containing protein [Maribacter dokdonensis]|uniref:tetratricopeptide repeat protein n=1 Tax=Maribacter dokdonensis TaxID=320912 RepID=UPI001B2DAE3A|nr:tetratricopeptide repeat protein [Maribacter dokdonensis]CAG2531652.1 Tetratricopeptide repeat-containing protein [Maribacter dokdonensis]
MEKWSKLFLSSFTFLLSISCGKSDNAKNPRTLAEERFKDATFYMQGSVAFQNGIAEAVSIDPTFEPGVYELSVADLKRGLPNEWLPQYNKAVVLNPEQRIPWRGYLYLWFYRDYEKAIADFNASDTITPYLDYPQGHSVDFWRGIAYLGAKDFDNSIAYWDKHITRETEDSGEDWVELEAFLYRGIAYYESDNKEKANENFDKVIQYFTNSADAKYYKAKLLLNEGHKKAALNMINDAIVDFNNGYFYSHNYVEVLKQIYLLDLEELKSKIIASN